MNQERQSQSYLESFALYLKRQGKEESTVKLYVAELRSAIGRLPAGGDCLARVTSGDLLAYRDELSARGMKPSTINKRMSILRSFFLWAGSEGLANPAAAEGLRVDEPAKPHIRWLTEEEERALLAVAAGGDEHAARNEALVAVMLYAGLRVEEVSWLRMDSVQASRLLIYDEGHITRSVPLDDRALIPLQRWRRQRMELSRSIHKESEFLFVTERSGYMQPRAVQFVIETLSAKAGLAVNCRALRHTYCRRLAKEGASAERIRAWAGHKSLLTTFRYFEENEDEERT